jgi:hypothetical protein
MTIGSRAGSIIQIMSYRSNAAEAWDSEPATSQEELHIDLLPPDSLNQPLRKRLLAGFKDRVAPEKLPPLLLTSRPLDLGLPLGERLLTPWFRTVFTNLGDVISPEVLPPLELESVPVDVGELVSDQISHMWFGSLLRNLADRLVPERLPKLELTSKPIDKIVTDTWMLLPAWSEVISTTKVFYPDKPSTATPSVILPRPVTAAASSAPYVPVRPPVEAALVRDLRRSRIRGYIWMGVAAAQVIYLVVSII